MIRSYLLLLALLALLLPASPTPATAAPPEGPESAAGRTAPPPGDEKEEEEGHVHRHRGPMDHSFADVERYAAMFESPERAEWQKPEAVVEALALRPGMVVADVGAGTGYFSARFAAAVGQGGAVLAADIEPAMIDYLRDRAEREGLGNLVPVLASTDDPRIPAGLADLVFICNTWHHIGDRVEYARRLSADLAPGGRVAILDYLPGDLPVGPPAGHKMSAAEVEAEMKQAGFRLADAPDLLPYQYLLVFEPAKR
jgi:ubiquinone/menaquinone biosynthesis C-methylase UbiE